MQRRQELCSSPRRWTDGLVGRRGGRWPSRTPRTGSRWWLWYLPMCPPDPEKVLGGLRIGRILLTYIGGNSGYLPALASLVAAASMACAVVVVLMASEKAEATFPGK